MKSRRLLLPENQRAQTEVQSSRSSLCQPCHVSMMPFALYAGLVSLVTSALSNYLSSQITTLEKQFGWPSRKTGMLVSMNDVGYLSSILVITYFTRQSHIPRILAICCIAFGVGAIICSLPNFVSSTGPQQNITASLTTPADDMNTSSLCVSSDRITPNYAGVHTCLQSNTEQISQAKTMAFALIATGMCLQGVAKSPRVPLILTYIDDNVKNSQTALYSGKTDRVFSDVFVGRETPYSRIFHLYEGGMQYGWRKC